MSSGYEEWEDIYKRNPLEALPWERGKPRESLVEFVGKGDIPPGKALDLCCGAGTNDIYLARNGFNVTAMDISATAVEYTREIAQRAGTDMELMVGNFVDLPFDDSTFDFVLDSGCFHHVLVEDRNEYVKGVHRVLKAGGRYLLICFSEENGPGWNHFTERQLKNIFSGHFKIVTSRHFGTVEGDGVVRFFHNILMEKT